MRLEDVFSIIMGQSPDGETVNQNQMGIEFHQGKIFFSKRFIQKSNTYTTKPSKIAPANSILLCVRAPVGKVNVTEREICIGRGLCAIISPENISRDYLYVYLESIEPTLIKQATGTTFMAISGDVIKNILVPLPPLAEQKRIVAKLEELEPLIEKYGNVADELARLISAI